MRFYGDPDALDGVAAQLRQRAELVRTAAADHQRAGQSARWVSMSASAYRSVVARDRTRVDGAAAALDGAADALSRHAAVVRERIAMIAQAEQAVTGWLNQRWKQAEQVVTQVAGTLDPFVRQLGQDPWGGLPFDPLRLPPSGDVAWLDVQRMLAAWHG
jgi:ABC-type transporter Mla subunit MlaD